MKRWSMKNSESSYVKFTIIFQNYLEKNLIELLFQEYDDINLTSYKIYDTTNNKIVFSRK